MVDNDAYSVGKQMMPGDAVMLLMRIAIVLLCLLAFWGCTGAGIVPNEANGIILQQIEKSAGYNAKRGEDCIEKKIRRSYELKLESLPEAYEKSEAAWCVLSEVLIRHPVNGDYYYYDDWMVVVKEKSTYRTLDAPRGQLDGVVTCVE